MLFHLFNRTRLHASLGMLAVSTHVAGVEMHSKPDNIVDKLPDFQSGVHAPGYFGLARDRAMVGYASQQEKWDAKLEQYSVAPALVFDYGRALSRRFGAGGTVTHRETQSEVVVNGIFAPKSNVRFRIAGSQLRSDAAGMPGIASVEQQGYLLGARKYWDSYEYLSDLGISAYTVEASAAAPAAVAALTDPDTLDAGMTGAQLPASGRTEGYQLSLNLRPSPASKLEFKHDLSQASYFADAAAIRSESQASSRIRYSHFFDDCLQLHGGYTSTSSAERFDLTLTRDKWNLHFIREQHDGGASTSMRIGYVVPLGRHQNTKRQCGSVGAPRFDSIVNATMKRPAQLPAEPMAIGTIR
ncbi:hypothetical protein [Noviherbaspirillum aerium]|uniref:hypothetical protein n=1 Tax=Noviherbaspirillum aerium TaxID=2588497 RepID=UPI00124DB9C0|nr:hypothetical protein [Noviherbaspirillum aerium]